MLAPAITVPVGTGPEAEETLNANAKAIQNSACILARQYVTLQLALWACCAPYKQGTCRNRNNRISVQVQSQGSQQGSGQEQREEQEQEQQ